MQYRFSVETKNWLFFKKNQHYTVLNKNVRIQSDSQRQRQCNRYHLDPISRIIYYYYFLKKQVLIKTDFGDWWRWWRRCHAVALQSFACTSPTKRIVSILDLFMFRRFHIKTTKHRTIEIAYSSFIASNANIAIRTIAKVLWRFHSLNRTNERTNWFFIFLIKKHIHTQSRQTLPTRPSFASQRSSTTWQSDASYSANRFTGSSSHCNDRTTHNYDTKRKENVETQQKDNRESGRTSRDFS